VSAAADIPRRWAAPAKLNLFLHVTGRRSDGYHELQTVFRLIDHGDELVFHPRDDGSVRCGLPGVPDDVNLAVRAARLLQARAGGRAGVDIRIDKRIPAGAGLGGGSSDAATTLIALNRLWDLGLSRPELARIAAGLGADVPVFIEGRNCWAEGIGERLTPIDLPPALYVIVVPAVAVSTVCVYADPSLTRDCPPLTISGFRAGHAGNVLEAVTRRLYPEVGRALEWLSAFGTARMTGSGAGVFAEVGDDEAGLRVLEALPRGWRGFIARGIDRHPLRALVPAGDAACGRGEDSTGV